MLKTTTHRLSWSALQRRVWHGLSFSLLLIGLATGLQALLGGSAQARSDAMSTTACAPLLDFEKRPLAGGDSMRLCAVYAGQVVVIVNTASKCGYTPQYESLESLYSQRKDEGLVVLGFPSNDFGAQEPGTEQQIAEFCRLTYGVEFPMFEKTHAAEAQADPLYQGLAQAAGGEFPRWNFHKYVLGRDGRLLASFKSGVDPKSSEFMRVIEAALSVSAS
jgi:glutathione peroxidase